jgi:hypothetical protein
MAGYNTHVAKPVEANELVTVVASLSGRLEKDPRPFLIHRPADDPRNHTNQHELNENEKW